MADVFFKKVVAKNEQTPAERFAAMEKTSDTFYFVGSDLYIGSTKITNAADLATAVSNITTNAEDISTINTTLTKLENDVNTTGSIRYLIKDYVDGLDAGDFAYDNTTSGLTATNMQDAIDEVAASAAGDVSGLTSRVAANENAITLLNKTDGTAGSVKKTVDDAIAGVIASAPSSLDTLKEISDWISGHEDSAAAMNSAIQGNTSAIGVASQEASGDDPAVVATGLHKKIEDETSRATTAESGLSGRITTLEGYAGNSSVSSQISSAIGDLDTQSDVVIASKSGDVVTLKAGVKEEDGVIAQGTGSDIVLEEVASTGAAADVSIADAGGYTSQTTVEGAIQEIYGKLTWEEI